MSRNFVNSNIQFLEHPKVPKTKIKGLFNQGNEIDFAQFIMSFTITAI